MSRTNNSNPNLDVGDLKKRIADEHKILQDKIDKIGGFRFTIKGWSITAVIAASAVGTKEGLLTGVMISLGLARRLLFFFHFEYEQVKLSRIFGNRARVLEAHLNRLDRVGRVVAPIPVPYMAHEVGDASRKRARRAAQPLDLRARWNHLKGWLPDWQISWKAHIYFYFVLIALAFLITMGPRYRTINSYWEALKVHIEPPPVLGPRPTEIRDNTK